MPTQAYPNGGGLTGGVQWTSVTSPTPWVNTASGSRNAFIHPDYATKDWTNSEKKYATMVRRVDNAVADLIQLLKDLNIDDETLIVFTSDNGAHKEGGHDPQSFESYANLNGIKRDMWEGGIKMPTLCRFPGTVPGNITVSFPSGHWDWYATFADLANVPIPAYTDGVSLMPSLQEDNDNQEDKGYLYHEYFNSGSTPNYSDFVASIRGRRRNEMQVIRLGDFKGVRYNISDHSDSFEIYNVVTDPRESINLAENMPMLEQKMHDKVLQVRKKEASAMRPYDDELIPDVSVSGLTNGLYKSIFQGAVDWVPNFDYLSPISTSFVSNIDEDSEEETTNFGISYKGYINIPTDGQYTFYLTSSSKIHVMLHDIHLLDNDYNYTSSEISEQLFLKAGMHPIKIEYQHNNAQTINIDLQLEGPGLTKAAIPDNMLFGENNTLSIGDSIISNNIILYPQPVKDQLRISISNPEISYDISIYSMLGQQVKHKKVKIDSHTKSLLIDTADLSSGIYIIRVSTDEGKTFTKKMIKS